MKRMFKNILVLVMLFSLVVIAQDKDKEKEKDILQQIKEAEGTDLVLKIKSLGKDKNLVKKLEDALNNEYDYKIAIAYSYILKVAGDKPFDGWKKILAVLNAVISKEKIDTKLARTGAEIALEMSDATFPEEKDEITIKDKLNEILEVNTDPFVSIYLGRAYQNLFIGEIKGINEVKKVLTESFDKDAKFWAAINLVELDIVDEPAITAVLESVASSKEHGMEKKKLAEGYLNIIRLKKRLEDKESSPNVPTTPTSKVPEKFKKVNQLINIVKKHYAYKEGLKEDDLIEACAKGIGDSLDAYSGYMDMTQTKKLTESVNMRYAGIGAVVSMRDAWLTIEQLIYNGPAYKAGLRSKDKIIKVEDEYTKSKTIEELVAKLKGIPGTKVRISVMRAGWDKEKEFIITREIINMGTVKFELISPEVAYFKIISFGEDTVDEFLKGLKKFRKQSTNNIKAVIFDLRDNSGGYLDSVLKLLNYFIPSGKIILTARGDKKIAEIQEVDEDFFEIKTAVENDVFVKNVYANDKVDKFEFKNVFVLVDEGTASAAEIFSGALQDYNIAKLIGTTSYGKGSIQQLFPLDENGKKSYLRLTIGRYYLPSGRSIHINRDKFGAKPKDAEGGLKPDFQIEKKEMDAWIFSAREKLTGNQNILNYVDKLVADNFELAKNLAINDNGNYKNYPGFNQLYKSLKTKLSKNSTREIVRFELRRKVMDQLGRELIYDTVDDYVLSKAFDIIAKNLSLSKENLGLVNKELPAKQSGKTNETSDKTTSQSAKE